MVATILLGQANAVHLPLADESVLCMITSPPYYALRNYGLAPTEWPPVTYVPMAGLEPVTVSGVKCCLGLESTPELYVAHVVLVMREVWRVLRPDGGTAWLVIGDSYSGSWGNYGAREGKQREKTQPKYARHAWDDFVQRPPTSKQSPGLKPKDLIGIPWRVAFALQADGWWLRSDVVWAKALSFCPTYSGSAMPESVNGWRWERCRVKTRSGDRARNQYQRGSGTKQGPGLAARAQREAYFQQDIGATEYVPCPGCPKCRDTGGYVLRKGSWRPTKSHEMVFMLAKSARYFGDREAVKEPQSEESAARAQRADWRTKPGWAEAHFGNPPRGLAKQSERDTATGRNPRSVWAIGDELTEFVKFCEVQGFDFEALVNAFLDGQSEVKDTFVVNPGSYKGNHYAVMPEALIDPIVRAATPEAGVCSACGKPWVRVVEETGKRQVRWSATASGPYRERKHVATTDTVGFRPSCDCNAEPRPAIVLDIFTGSGTTNLVARRLGRRSIGLDLSYSYLHDQARERLALDALAAWQDGEAIDGDGQDLDELPLFANPKLL